MEGEEEWGQEGGEEEWGQEGEEGGEWEEEGGEWAEEYVVLHLFSDGLFQLLQLEIAHH